MKREIYAKLLEWKSRKDHKPLVLDGARQVGKTYILKEFGNKEYKTLSYVNLDKHAVGWSSCRKIYQQGSQQDKVIGLPAYWKAELRWCLKEVMIWYFIPLAQEPVCLRYDVHTGMSRKGADDTRGRAPSRTSGLWSLRDFHSSSFAYISLFIQQKFGRIFSQNQQKFGQ